MNEREYGLISNLDRIRLILGLWNDLTWSALHMDDADLLSVSELLNEELKKTELDIAHAVDMDNDVPTPMASNEMREKICDIRDGESETLQAWEEDVSKDKPQFGG